MSKNYLLLSTQVPFRGRMKTLSSHKGYLPFAEAVNVVIVINQRPKLGVFHSNNHTLRPGQSLKAKCHPGCFSCDTSYLLIKALHSIIAIPDSINLGNCIDDVTSHAFMLLFEHADLFNRSDECLNSNA